MEPSCLVSTVQAAGGVLTLWGSKNLRRFWVGPSSTTAYLSVVADHLSSRITTLYPFSSCSQLGNAQFK